jgi:hypothetical protein
VWANRAANPLSGFQGSVESSPSRPHARPCYLWRSRMAHRVLIGRTVQKRRVALTAAIGGIVGSVLDIVVLVLCVESAGRSVTRVR